MISIKNIILYFLIVHIDKKSEIVYYCINDHDDITLYRENVKKCILKKYRNAVL